MLLKLFRRKHGPPSPADAMSRVIILKHLLVTAMASPPASMLADLAETRPAELDALLEALRARRRESVRQLQETGLWDSTSPGEQAFLTTSPEDIPEEARTDVSWLMEGAECLLWALGHLDALPLYDTQSEIEHLNSLPKGTVRDLLASATLRDAKAISNARDVAELWHWRSRTRQLAENGTPVDLPQGRTLNGIVRDAAELAASRGDIPPAIENDFPAFGRAYGQVSSDEWAQATSIAIERHRAFNWLCGRAPGNRWDDTPTDT